MRHDRRGYVEGLEDDLGREHVARRAFGDDSASTHDRNTIGELRGEVQVVEDRESAATALHEPPRRLKRRALVREVEARRGLVEEQVALAG